MEPLAGGADGSEPEAAPPDRPSDDGQIDRDDAGELVDEREPHVSSQAR
jgi:hypothetical protein